MDGRHTSAHKPEGDPIQNGIRPKYLCDLSVVVLQQFFESLVTGGPTPHIQIVEHVLDWHPGSFET